MWVAAVVLMVCGVFFLTVSALGLLRLPDFYARTHAVGKSETLGSILVLAGLMVYNGWELSTFKILFVLIFVLIANPTATHCISRAALHSGLAPWTKVTGKQTSGERERKGDQEEHDLAS